MKLKPVSSILGILAAATVMLGCGLEAQPFGGEAEAEVSPVVTSERIAAERPGTAKATVLTWWRGLQTRNPDAVLAAYAKGVRDEIPKEFPVAMVALGTTVAQSALSFDSVELSDESNSVVYATIVSPNAAVSGPVGLPMMKKGDEWLFSNTTFLDGLIAALALGGQPAPSAEPAPEVSAGEE